MKSLFEITQDVIELASLLEDGEFTPELEQKLAITREELENKAINYAKVIKQSEADVDTIDKEMSRLLALKEVKTKIIDRMKDSVSNAMKLFKVDKIETPLMKLSFRKSEVFTIEDENKIDKIFIKTKETKTIDKAKIKALIKAGHIVKGAKIVEKQNLQIK